MKNNQATKEDIEYYSKLKEKYYRQFCKEDQATFHLVEGSYDYFKQLKDQKIPFTIASASIKENIDFFVESFQLDKWMKVDDIIYDNGTYQNKLKLLDIFFAFYNQYKIIHIFYYNHLSKKTYPSMTI
mgnify:CR=1 FL=1